MRSIWVKIDPWDKDLATTALEGGADGVVVPEGYSSRVKELGKILTVAPDGDLVPGEDVIFYTIESGEDEEEILRLSKTHRVVLQSRDWTIIPLENLIARGAEVVAEVSDLGEARTAFGILEKGVNHILLHPSDAGELKGILSRLRSVEETLPLVEAEVLKVEPVGMGDRVCVDTCTSMQPGEGMLVGNSSRALFLIHAETLVNPYVAPRPFRVNAGPVHAYTRVPGGRTRYLSELKAGDEVLVVDHRGKTAAAVVGRLKIEKRPLMLVTARMEGLEATTIVQNAETIRLTSPDGGAVSVVQLAPGDRVLAAVEEAGRHFGHKIRETITEQ